MEAGHGSQAQAGHLRMGPAPDGAPEAGAPSLGLTRPPRAIALSLPPLCVSCVAR